MVTIVYRDEKGRLMSHDFNSMDECLKHTREFYDVLGIVPIDLADMVLEYFSV